MNTEPITNRKKAYAYTLNFFLSGPKMLQVGLLGLTSLENCISGRSFDTNFPLSNQVIITLSLILLFGNFVTNGITRYKAGQDKCLEWISEEKYQLKLTIKPLQAFLYSIVFISLLSTGMMGFWAVYHFSCDIAPQRFGWHLSSPLMWTLIVLCGLAAAFTSYCFQLNHFEKNICEFFKVIKNGNKKFYAIMLAFLISSGAMTFYVNYDALNTLSHTFHFSSGISITLTIILSIAGIITGLSAQTLSVSKYLKNKEKSREEIEYETHTKPFWRVFFGYILFSDLFCYSIAFSFITAFKLAKMMPHQIKHLGGVTLLLILLAVNISTSILFTWKGKMYPELSRVGFFKRNQVQYPEALAESLNDIPPTTLRRTSRYRPLLESSPPDCTRFVSNSSVISNVRHTGSKQAAYEALARHAYSK